MNDLRHTLLDIATTSIHGLNNTRGPNLWENVRDDRSAYGADFDFEIYRYGADTIINPVCEAALQWCYAKLPEDCPRWSVQGFKLDTIHEAPHVLAAMRRDGLLSDGEYTENMLANERDQYAGDHT